jgi:hypothetical protein
MKEMSRQTAIQLGLKRYFTGVPCIHGHVCERSARSSECIECYRLRKQKQKERNPDLVRLRNRLSKQRQKARDPERVRQQWREWSARQKAKEKAAQHA